MKNLLCFEPYLGYMFLPIMKSFSRDIWKRERIKVFKKLWSFKIGHRNMRP